MADQHVLVVEHADPGVARRGAAARSGSRRGSRAAPAPSAPPRPARRRPRPAPRTRRRGRPATGAAGRRRQVPFDHQPRLAHQQRHVVGRRRPADVGARRRPALQVGEQVDRGARRARPRASARAAQSAAKRSSPRSSSSTRPRRWSAPSTSGALKPAGAQPGGDREERPDVEPALRRHVHQDAPGERARRGAAARSAAPRRRRPAASRFGPAPALAGEELADLGRAGHAAAASASAAGSQSQPGRAPRAARGARRRRRAGCRGRASAGARGSAGPSRSAHSTRQIAVAKASSRPSSAISPADAEPVEVGVPELDRGAEVVGLHQRVARRGDVLGAAERGQPGARSARGRRWLLPAPSPPVRPRMSPGAEVRGEGAAEPLGGGRIRERQG